MASGAMEKREHLGREALDLLALLGGGTDRIQDDVVAAGGAEALDRLGTLLGGAEDPVFPREGLEVLRVPLRERLGPHGLGRLVVTAHGDEGEVRGGEMREIASGGAGRGTDLVETLPVPLGLHHVRDPAVPLPAGAREGGGGTSAGPAGGAGRLRRPGSRPGGGALGDPPPSRRGAGAPESARGSDAPAPPGRPSAG